MLAIEDALLVSTTSQPGAAWSQGPGTRVHLGGGHVFSQASIRRLTRNLGLMIQGLLGLVFFVGDFLHLQVSRKIDSCISGWFER